MRMLESHMRTIDYFIKLGWTVDYEIYHQREDVKPQMGYRLFIYRPNADEPDHVENCRSLIGTMITASEWLTDTVQNAGRKLEEVE